MSGDEIARWDNVVELLALVAELVAVGNWQRANGKGPRPKRIPRPRRVTRVGGVAHTLDELDELLGWTSPRR